MILARLGLDRKSDGPGRLQVASVSSALGNPARAWFPARSRGIPTASMDRRIPPALTALRLTLIRRWAGELLRLAKRAEPTPDGVTLPGLHAQCPSLWGLTGFQCCSHASSSPMCAIASPAADPIPLVCPKPCRYVPSLACTLGGLYLQRSCDAGALRLGGADRDRGPRPQHGMRALTPAVADAKSPLRVIRLPWPGLVAAEPFKAPAFPVGPAVRHSGGGLVWMAHLLVGRRRILQRSIWQTAEPLP